MISKFLILVFTVFFTFGLVTVKAQRRQPKVVEIIDGDSVYQVLPADAIAAIRRPTFVSGEKARVQMSDAEPVMAIEVDGEARAYSLWQLDAHEIVDDQVGDTPIAVTW